MADHTSPAHPNHSTPAGVTRRRHIGLFLFDGVEELDAVGPWEVLAYWTQQHPEDGWNVSCVSADGGPVLGAKNLTLGAHHSFRDAPSWDVLIHPGGAGTRRLLRDPDHLDWVRQQRATVPLMASVCSGSLVYAAAGLLTGRRATTHWASLNTLSELDPTIITDVDARYVDDDDLITSAGVSAGIDMALHLVARFAGTARAREVRREIQYDPRPPV
jgi:transcriptional regulator GlxA family with amidase domain